MNELSPGMRRSLPAGRPGAGCVGRGMRSEAWAWDTLVFSVSTRPPRYATAAAPAVTPPVIRNVRRSGDAGMAGRYRSGGPPRAGGRALGGGSTARGATRASRARAIAPAAAPARVGSRYTGVAFGLVSAADR